MKHIPKLNAEAEAFLEKEFSGLDFSQFKPARFEFQAKDAQINMRLPSKLLAAVKASAKSSGIRYQRFICETLEHIAIQLRACVDDAHFWFEHEIYSPIEAGLDFITG